MPVNYKEDKVRKILSEIHGALILLKDLKLMPLAQFISDKHRISSAKYNFIVAIEGMIDLSTHIIASNGWAVPKDYSDAFTIMTENGAIQKDSLPVLIKMARFRNRLVHIYWEVDANFLYEVLQKSLSDIQGFVDEIMIFLDI